MNEKRVVQDIVPGNKRTIRNLSADRIKTNRRKLEREERETEEKGEVGSMNNTENLEKRQTKKKKIIRTLLAFAVIFIGIFIIATASSLLYLKAVVTIIPKTVKIDINGTFTANKDAKFPDLAYEVKIATSSMRQTVSDTDGPIVENKDSGFVYVYNEQLS